MNVKETIVEIASSMGFHRTVIGSLEAMDEGNEQFRAWLSKGYAAQMDYLKRNPHFRTSPALTFPQARSAIIVSVSYFTDVPEPPGQFFGKVARYAVGLDYHAVIRKKLRELKAALEACLGRNLLAKAVTDDVALFEQAYAVRHGLGFAGKNTLIIGPKLSGSYNFVAELFSDLEIEPDEPYRGTCGKCFRCGAACPTGAIQLIDRSVGGPVGSQVGGPIQVGGPSQVSSQVSSQVASQVGGQVGRDSTALASIEASPKTGTEAGIKGGTATGLGEGEVDSNLCISYLTIENKGEIPVALRAKVGRWFFGCDICQEVCPYNQRPPQTPWQEFSPQSGVGHYLDLLQLLPMKDQEFERKFQASPLRRPRLRGLKRNAFTVLGNCLADCLDSSVALNSEIEAATNTIFAVACQENDPMLREHALWCLAQHKDRKTRELTHKLAHLERDPDNRIKMMEYMG